MPPRILFTMEEKSYMVRLWFMGETYQDICHEFRRCFPHTCLPSRAGLYKKVKFFENSNSVQNLFKGHSGRPRSVRTLAKITEVRNALLIEKDLALGMQRSSGRRNNFGLSNGSFNLIVHKDLKMHPYRLSHYC